MILDDTNFSLWLKHMEMHIGARNKSEFLTNSTPKLVGFYFFWLALIQNSIKLEMKI